MAIHGKYMDVDAVSAYLGVHKSTIYRLLKRDDFPGARVGADWRFKAESVDRWFLERERGSRRAKTRDSSEPLQRKGPGAIATSGSDSNGR